MNFAAWNVRGMSDPIKAADVRKVCSENDISLVGLLETRVNHSNEVRILQTISRRWNFVINSLARKRIWICWDSDVWDVVIVKEHPQFIHCSITNLRDNASFFATFTYASNSFVKWRFLW